MEKFKLISTLFISILLIFSGCTAETDSTQLGLIAFGSSSSGSSSKEDSKTPEPVIKTKKQTVTFSNTNANFTMIDISFTDQRIPLLCGNGYIHFITQIIHCHESAVMSCLFIFLTWISQSYNQFHFSILNIQSSISSQERKSRSYSAFFAFSALCEVIVKVSLSLSSVFSSFFGNVSFNVFSHLLPTPYSMKFSTYGIHSSN